jgi:hypothetical protein
MSKTATKAKARPTAETREPVKIKEGEVFVQSTFLRRAFAAGYTAKKARQLFDQYETKGVFGKHKMIGVLQDTQSYIVTKQNIEKDGKR